MDPIHLEPAVYDVILDKGTFDAITLMEGFGQVVRDRYVKNVSALLKENGHYIIATCNWTRNEIVQHMSASMTLTFPRFNSFFHLSCDKFRFFYVGASTDANFTVWRKGGKQCDSCCFPKAISVSFNYTSKSTKF